MPQNDFDTQERARKRIARESHKRSYDAQNLRGHRAKMMQEARRVEKIQMRKKIKVHEERNIKSDGPSSLPSEPVPNYLVDRQNDPRSAKALSSSIKQRRAEKSARYSVPLPKVRGISEEEMFRMVTTGKKTKKKSWKRMITKPTFVGEGFTRQNPKMERFIRPSGLRQRTAHVSHPELAVTIKAPILSVKKNPSNPLYTRLGVLTKGCVIEVNTSELGLTTASGKVIWGRYAQITSEYYECRPFTTIRNL
ncbi:Ribosome biogenesis protein nsa2, partial [Metarhizium hybridum]